MTARVADVISITGCDRLCPSGKSVCRFGKACRKTVVPPSQNRVCRQSNFASGFNGESVIAVNQKYFTSVFRKIMVHCRHPVPARGALWPFVTERGAGCDGRGRIVRRTMRLRTAKARGPDVPTLTSSLRQTVPQATAASKPGRRGERVISRKPLRRERRNVSADL
jgi:hypothetical protein